MKIDQELARSSPDRDSVLTIGVFDGVHRGHSHLVHSLIRVARNLDHLAGVVTFTNHPASILQPDFKPQYLTAPGERVQLIGDLGADFVVPITFDRDLSSLDATQFAGRLQRHLRMRGLVVGPDFAMGHKRGADVKKLTSLGQQMGFSVNVVDLLLDGGHAIRSTNIREAVTQGDVTHATALLGRYFTLTGAVARGEGRGRTLGFPTVNLEVPPGMAIPGEGIYATWAHVGECRYMAATSIGTRPTFGENELTIEAFIMDFDGDVYGQQVNLEFVKHLRGEIKYDNVDDLLVQIGKDVDDTRVILQSDQSI